MAVNETFRHTTYSRIQAIVCTAIFLALIVGFSTTLFADEATIKGGYLDRRSAIHLTCFSETLFGLMLLGAVYVLVLTYIARVSIDGSTLSIRSVFQNRQFDSSDVKMIQWRARDGMIIFHVNDRKAKLGFFGFKGRDRLKIIGLVRDLVPHDKQEDWPMYCQKFALPLRERIRVGNLRFLRTMPQPYPEWFLFAVLGWFVVLFGGMTSIGFLRASGTAFDRFMNGCLAVSMPLMILAIYHAFAFDKRKKRADAVGAETAAARWKAGALK